ncbi:DHHA1 domain-containing protein [Methanobacterium petrolearium]|uniref:DHHA1 domain-containing protein n=1 Tax=Methanobacterium petrolearium TaxID=710190 RepID=UPI001AE7AAC5|nr:DHH family phosphoesterase [Methanobacterium petrolearium]MBP1944832.1 RecJ-like exonuclease [Methanobacterium petrolearium]BDZ70123.1 phosphoesterase [Methanobacterium petrolearium]
MNQNKQHYLLNRAEEAGVLLKEHLDGDHVVRVISHNDSDGISAAGVICNAISQEGGKFHVTMVPRLKEEVLNRLAREKYELFFFCDMGSGFVERISRLNGQAIIADHHQTMDQTGDDAESLIHVNPHLFGLDGTRDVSASGVTYLTVRPLKKVELSGLALVGAFGDMQYSNGFQGVNQTILTEATKSGVVEEQEDLKIASKVEPLYKALAHTFQPAIPGISGDLEGSQAFLEKIGISYGIKFTDLANEEKDFLTEQLTKLNPQIFGNVYSIPKENPALRNLENYAEILDACGKNKRYSVGLSICLGDRESAVAEGVEFLNKYHDSLIKGISWIRREGSQEMECVQYIYTEDKEKKKIMGTLASLGIDLDLLNPQKPVITLSRMHDQIKVSGRTTMKMTGKGVNLGFALEQAAKSFNGAGGGHTIAAGAVVPYRELENFKNLVNDIVSTQLSG